VESQAAGESRGVTPSRPAWTPDAGRPLERYRALVLVLGLSLCLQTLTFSNRWGAPDERERVVSAERLLDAATLRLPEGRHTKYPPLTTVLMAPGVLLKRILPGHDDAWLMVPSLVAGASMVVPFQRALMVLGVPLGGTVVAAAVFAVANPAWPYTKRLYSEPFTAVFVLWAFALALMWRAHRNTRDLVLSWAALAAAVGNNSVVLTLIPVLAAMLAVQELSLPPQLHRRSAVLSLALGTGVVALWMGVNWLKFGSVLESGYHDTTIPNDVFDGRNGFSTPPWLGLYGLMFSAGRGLVFYAPLALLGLWALRTLRARFNGAALWLFLGGAVPTLIYSGWWSWHGGTCYGPRLIIPFIPLWMLGIGPLLTELRERAVGGTLTRVFTALVCAWSGFASFTGTLFMFSYDQQFWIRDKPFNDFLDVYTPQYTLLQRAWRNAILFPDDINFMWLAPSPRPPLELQVSPGTRQVQLELTNQARRDTWSIAEVIGGDANADIAPAQVLASDGARPELMMDQVLETVWSGGPQRQGQWVKVMFDRDVEMVRFTHGANGQGYPRFVSMRSAGENGVMSPAKEVHTPVGPLGVRWPAWVLLLGLVACLRGVKRWSGWFTRDARAAPPPPPPVETGP